MVDPLTPINNTKEKLSGRFLSFLKGYWKFGLLLLVLLVFAGVLFYFFYSQNLKNAQPSSGIKITTEKSTPTPKPTLKPTPIPLKPDNGTKGTYQVSQANHQGPTFRQAVLDPLDAKKGQTLKFELTIENGTPIQEVSGIILMDNSQKPISFSKVSRNLISEKWQGEIVLNDSVLYIYTLTFTAKSDNGSSSVTITPR